MSWSSEFPHIKHHIRYLCGKAGLAKILQSNNTTSTTELWLNKQVSSSTVLRWASEAQPASSESWGQEPNDRGNSLWPSQGLTNLLVILPTWTLYWQREEKISEGDQISHIINCRICPLKNTCSDILIYTLSRLIIS